MKYTTRAAALIAFASTVHAQTFSIDISGPGNVGTQATSFTLEVYGDATVGTHMLGGAFSLESNSSFINSISWTPAPWSSFNTDNGYAGDGNYNQVIFGQLLLPIPPFNIPAEGSELGNLIGTFVVDKGDGGPFIDFQLVAGTPFTLETYDVVTGQSYTSTSDSIQLGSVRVFATPTPSSIALLGLSGIMTRRRRSKS